MRNNRALTMRIENFLLSSGSIIVPMTKQSQPSFSKITDARHRIDPIFLNTALFTDTSLGLTLAVKDETDNPIRCFKGRGTGYYLACSNAERGRLVTASAGNFGQGLAYGAAKLDRELTVFASLSANPLKIEAMRKLGAEVILFGDDFDAAKARAREYALEIRATFVEDGASASIAEGAGTIAAELTEAFADIDAVFIPLGNGALAAGIGCWFKTASPGTKVIAVAATGAPCMQLSWQAGRPVSTNKATTIADGIAVRDPVPVAVEWLATTIDDIVLVDDACIVDAMQFAHSRWNRVVEPAGAAGLAGVLAMAETMQGARVATMLCGGNLTPHQIAEWLPEAVEALGP